MEAIELARIAHPKEVAQRNLIVGITIQAPTAVAPVYRRRSQRPSISRPPQALKLVENG